MKWHKHIGLIVIVMVCLPGCQKIVEPGLETGPERLVIDARINLFKGEPSNYQFVKLERSTAFYQENKPPATGAVVTVTDDLGNTFNYQNSNTEPGLYEHMSFTPEIGRTYTLRIEYNGHTYEARETLTAVPEIERLFNTLSSIGFEDEEKIRLNIQFTDPVGPGNHYMWEAYFPNAPDTTVFFQIEDDDFLDGNLLLDYPLFLADLEFEEGELIEVHQSSIPKESYDYYTILLSNIQPTGGFGTTPVTPRSNIANITNTDHYPLGHFKVSQVDREQLTIYRP